MDRRSFLKTGVLAVATVPFLSIGDTQAADVQIFIKNVEESIQTNRFSNSQLYFNHFYQPNQMCWVWTPHGWTIQACPAYVPHTMSFRSSLYGYHQLTQRKENIKQININNADCIYILENGSIKIYDRREKGITFSSDVPSYAAGLRMVDSHYRNRTGK